MGEGSIQRLFILLIVTTITVAIQYFIIKVVVKDSIKKQILSSVFITIVWYILSIASIYKEYYDLFYYTSMLFILIFIVNSIFTINGKYYDSRRIMPKYKTIILIFGFILIGLLWLDIVNIYLFLTGETTILLLIYFIDYKKYNNHD